MLTYDDTEELITIICLLSFEYIPRVTLQEELAYYYGIFDLTIL